MAHAPVGLVQNCANLVCNHEKNISVVTEYYQTHLDIGTSLLLQEHFSLSQAIDVITNWPGQRFSYCHLSAYAVSLPVVCNAIAQ